MRLVAVGLSSLVIGGCGAKYKAAGPVMSGYERAVKFPVHRPHDNLAYSGRKPASTAPIIPLMAFGAAFDLDFALMPREGDFNMLEFARINLPEGHLWLALETLESGEQTLVANVDDIEAIMPELPLPRLAVDNFTTTDLSTESTVDVSLSYDNSRGNRVDAQLLGEPPIAPERNRNGRIYNHSQNQLLTVLDIPASESLFKADVTVDGKGLSMRKIAGFVPARFVQQQAQGGLAIGTYRLIPSGPAAGGPTLGSAVLSVQGEAPPPPEPVQLDPDVLVKMGVAQNFTTVKGCYLTRVEEEGADLAGRMQVDWTVSEGVVTQVALAELEGDDVLVDEALSACISTAVEGWSFDTSVSGQVSWPFTFVAATDDAPATAELGEGSFQLGSADDEGSEAPGDETLGDEDLLEGIDEAPEDEGEGQDEGEDEEALPDPDDLLGEDMEAEAEEEELEPGELSNFSTIHKLPSGSSVTLPWAVTQQGDRVTAVQTTPLRTLTYNYRYVSDNYLELVSITVEQYGRATPVTAITFNPPLPDVRWPFNGRRTSDFVIDVNGQQNHGYGQVDAYWTETGPKLKVNPLEPKWTADRVMQTSILFQADGAANVVIERIGE